MMDDATDCAKDDFLIRLAGVTIKVVSRDSGQRRRFLGYVVECQEATEPPAFVVEVSDGDLREALRQLRIANGESFVCSDSYLENIAIHSAIAENMIDHDVLVMHGSAICMDDEAYIFTAPSGTGKSTHSRLWREAFGERAFMINDDKPMLVCKKDGVVACGTPWNGKHRLGQNVGKRLRAIAFLERGEENSIAPVEPETLFELLYLQTYHPKDPTRAMRAMALLSRICDNVHLYQLKCNMDPEAALVSYGGMQSPQKQTGPNETSLGPQP